MCEYSEPWRDLHCLSMITNTNKPATQSNQHRSNRHGLGRRNLRLGSLALPLPPRSSSSPLDCSINLRRDCYSNQRYQNPQNSSIAIPVCHSWRGETGLGTGLRGRLEDNHSRNCQERKALEDHDHCVEHGWALWWWNAKEGGPMGNSMI